MPYNCATWEPDGYKAGPRHAPTLTGRFAAQGWLQKEEVHASLQSRLRVQLATYLGVRGPTTTPALARALGCSLDRIGTKLRGMHHGGLLDYARISREPGKVYGRTPRVWWINETGRWSIWRQAWLTRCALSDPGSVWEGAEGVPDDPVEAVSLHLREEFLRPGSYRALQYMLSARLVTMRETALALGIAPPILIKRMHWWARCGWVEQVPFPAGGLPGKEHWCWHMTDSGLLALYRHVDALRKAAMACGWEPTPGAVAYGPGRCEYEYEREYLEMGWQL